MRWHDRTTRTVKLFGMLLMKAGNAWLNDKAMRLGAALAFYSVLSLAPLLLLVLMVAAFVWGHEGARGEISQHVASFVGKEGAAAIQNILTAADKNKNDGLVATLVGIGALLFSASSVFGELHDALNLIWKVGPRNRPFFSMIRERFTSFIMVISSGILLLISLILSACLASLSIYINGLLPHFLILMRIVDFFVSLGLIAFLFTLTFKVVPDIAVSWRGAWPGGVLTAFMFVIGKIVIGYYLSYAAVASTYGVAGSLVVLLLWIYYSVQILLFGAEFTHIYSVHFAFYCDPAVDGTDTHHTP